MNKNEERLVRLLVMIAESEAINIAQKESIIMFFLSNITGIPGAAAQRIARNFLIEAGLQRRTGECHLSWSDIFRIEAENPGLCLTDPDNKENQSMEAHAIAARRAA